MSKKGKLKLANNLSSFGLSKLMLIVIKKKQGLKIFF